MLTEEEDVEIHALAKRGWTVSGIARHTGRDRKTVRAYLSGEHQPGVRAATEPDPFDLIEAYVRQRLVDDHGLWATTLFDEVTALGVWAFVSDVHPQTTPAPTTSALRSL